MVVDDDDAGVEEVVSVKIPISLGRRVSARTISARESFARAVKFADLSELWRRADAADCRRLATSERLATSD